MLHIILLFSFYPLKINVDLEIIINFDPMIILKATLILRGQNEEK